MKGTYIGLLLSGTYLFLSYPSVLYFDTFCILGTEKAISRTYHSDLVFMSLHMLFPLLRKTVFRLLLPLLHPQTHFFPSSFSLDERVLILQNLTYAAFLWDLPQVTHAWLLASLCSHCRFHYLF